MRPSLRKAEYGQLVADLSTLLEQARRRTVRTVNAVMTTVYWEMGRRIVEFEQGGKSRDTVARISKHNFSSISRQLAA